MKSLLILMPLFVLLSSFSAYAQRFSCVLDLNLLEDTDSSEIKQLVFDIDTISENAYLLTGNLISTSCFNTITKPFTSSSATFDMGQGDSGILSNANVEVGMYHYKFNFEFTKNSDEPGFRAKGNVFPLDNKYFIHQIAEGSCQFANSFASLIKPPMKPDCL